MHLEDYEFYDEDIISVNNCAYIGNEEVVEFLTNRATMKFSLHRDDVIQLAKSFGLAVYERKSKL